MYVVHWLMPSKPTLADGSIDTVQPTMPSPKREDEKMDGLGEHVLSEEFNPSGTNDSTSQGQIEFQNKKHNNFFM